MVLMHQTWDVGLVVVQLTKSVDETIQDMLDITRAWAEAPYRKQITALECIAK